MPIYDYHCQNCNKTFEMLVSNKDSEVTCPDCQSIKVDKLMSTFTPIFHGSGFYKTDYAKKVNKE